MDSFVDIQESLLASGNLYEDEYFPAEDKSLRYENISVWDNVTWKRPNEICSDPQFFIGSYSKHDIAQGSLGNCWFLSATSVLATKKKLFKKVIPLNQSFQENYCGIFRFNFWRYGEWIEVVVDDRLPTRNNKLIFCHNPTNADEFWAALFEKAYAKLHGSYQALESGFSHDAFVDFTGGIGQFIDLRKTEIGPVKMFRKLKQYFKMNSLLCAAIEIVEGGQYENKLDTGLMAGHAYSITNLIDFKNDESKEKLIRLRNPWGSVEWNGAWSDGSDEWNALSEQYELTIEDDGEFWMSLSDFLNNFHSVQVCHLHPENIAELDSENNKCDWKFSSFDGRWIKGVSAGGAGIGPNEGKYWTNPQYLIQLTDPDEDDKEENCTLIVSLMQKYNRRMKTAMKTSDETEEAIAFDILRFKGNPNRLNGSNFDGRKLKMEDKMSTYEYFRERSFHFLLPPGNYCLIPCTYNCDVEGEFLLRIVAEKDVNAQEIGAE